MRTLQFASLLVASALAAHQMVQVRNLDQEYDKLFLDQDERLAKAGNFKASLDWSYMKEAKNVKLMNEEAVSFGHLNRQRRNLQHRQGLLHTALNAESAGGKIEFNPWAFRTLYATVEDAVRVYEDTIDAEQVELKGLEADIAKLYRQLENREELLASSNLELDSVRSGISKIGHEFHGLPREKQEEIFKEVRDKIRDMKSRAYELEALIELLNEPFILETKIAELETFQRSLKRNVDKRIAKIQLKIEFIRKHPDLFVIARADRFAVQGAYLDELEGGLHYKDPLNGDIVLIPRPGDGRIVTVIDENIYEGGEPEIIHPLLRMKMTNPEENCEAFGGLSSISGTHATQVASIIVCDHPRLGLATSAQVQMLPVHKAEAAALKSNMCFGPEGPPDIEFNEKLYASLLEEFRSGRREFILKDSVTLLCPGLDDDQWHVRGARESSCFPEVQGNIINFSRTYQHFGRFASIHIKTPEISVEQFYFQWYMMFVKQKLLVKSLGNQGLQVGAGFMFRQMKALAGDPGTRDNLLLVTNLDIDGLRPHKSSTLPGKNVSLQVRTVSAIGTDIDVLENSPQSAVRTTRLFGTSFSAPFVSAVAAIIESECPDLSPAEIANCILDSATPIVLVGKERTRLEPIALAVMSYEFVRQGLYQTASGELHQVDEEMMDMSRETFGHGRVHLEHALQLAIILSKAKKYDDLEMSIMARDYDDLRDALHQREPIFA